MLWFTKHIDSGASDEVLMTLIHRKNKHAFEILYARYFQKLVSYANSFVQDRHLAEDMIQEVFIKLIESPEKFDTDKKFSTWVYTVTANLAKNHLRNNQSHRQWIRKKTDTLQSARLHHELDRRQLSLHLQHVYENLNEKEKNIFTLRFGQELSIREIACIMQIPEGTVKSGIFYLLKKYNHLIQHFSYEH